MAASKPKRSVKQPLNPDFVYDFPAMVFPTDFDPNVTPSVAAQSAAQVPVTGAVGKKKSTKSTNIQDQLELEQLRQQKLLSQKENLGAEALQTTQEKMSADAHGQLVHDQSQEKILA